VLVRGESGLGKTTLVERVVTGAALEGASVARVRCHELERELPFGVMGSVVSQLLDLPGAGATAPEQLAELGRLVAKVRQRWPSLPAPLPVVGEGARIQFSEAVLALMHALAEEQPLALVVDDIHLADATSLAVLHLLLRRLEAVPVMVLLTSAVSVADEAPSARRFVDNAEALALTLVALGPLPAVHAAELLDALVAQDAPPSPTVRKALLAGARGNPMVLELLVADWQRRGDASLAMSLGAMTAGASGPPPEALRRVVGDTLAVLDPEARAVVELGAILGQRLNDLSMYMLVDLPVARTMRAMTTLTSHRVLRDAGSHLEFSNEYMRGQCYVAMASPLRRRLHSLVADRLLAQDGADEPIPGLEVAWHLVRGDRLPEAVPYLLAGGRESIRRGAPHEADLALTTGLPALTGAPRRAAILLLAEALQELGRWGDSLQVLDTPCDPYDESEECCREVLRVIARRWIGCIPLDEMPNDLNRLCEIALRQVDIEVRVKALSATPYLQTQTRRADTLEMIGTALTEVGMLPMDDYQRLHLLMARAWWLDQQGDFEGALRDISEGVRLIDCTGFASSVAVRLVVGAGVLDLQRGQYEGAALRLERAGLMARRIDNLIHYSAAAAGLAIAAGRSGRYEDQMDWAKKALSSLPKDEWSIVALSGCYELAVAYAMLGRDSEALGVLTDQDGRFRRRTPSWMEQSWLFVQADVFALVGQRKRAIAHAKRALELNPAGPLIGDFSGPHARWTAIVGITTGDANNALATIEQISGGNQALHAKDRAEALASIALVHEALGLETTTAKGLALQELRNLPSAVSTVLCRLGLTWVGGNGTGAWGP
jgi:tetratricopeptide (TPR) repeat protein